MLLNRLNVILAQNELKELSKKLESYLFLLDREHTVREKVQNMTVQITY